MYIGIIVDAERRFFCASESIRKVFSFDFFFSNALKSESLVLLRVWNSK